MKIVMTHGCWDILHPGHLHHLRCSKALGDILIVSVTSDRFVGKGDGRPRFALEERMAMLREFRCVDHVLESDAPTPDAVLRHIRPNIYTKGPEYVGKWIMEYALAKELDFRIVFTDWKVYSTSELLKCAS